MSNILKKIPTKVFDFFKKMEKAQRTRFIVLVTVIIVILITVSVFLNQKTYSALYSGMDPADAGEVMTVLSEMQVDAKPQGDDTILVSDDQIDNVRMQLAGQGYPNSGVNFDIFKNASGLGVTDMERKIYYQFQLQENLRQTLRKMDIIEDAVVNINLPEESPFALSEDEKPATAAVMLMLYDNQKINGSEVKAIAELVSKSVAGLKIEDVRILDSKMNLYSVQEDDEIENLNTQMELQYSIQQRLQEQIVNLLNPVFGEGNALAEVNVVLNFDTKITETVEFAPPAEGSEGLVISMKELTETIKNADVSGGVAGVDANGGASQYAEINSDNDDAAYQTISREANYEINETKTQIENAKGQIQDLSVSVILNSTENLDDYTDNVKELVANAIGVDTDRITVEMLPFKELEETSSKEVFSAQQELLNDVQKQSTVRLIIILLAALAIMIFIFAIIKMFRPKKNDVQQKNMGWDEGIDLVADEELIPDAIPKEINFENKDDKVAVLEEYINQNPESVANLLRNWLNDDYSR